MTNTRLALVGFAYRLRRPVLPSQTAPKRFDCHIATNQYPGGGLIQSAP